MDYKYKFSVIVPIYNVEKYLAEALDSVINQTIGFEENIQLILVNDGSPDNSGDICIKYRDMYPENIIYIDKENEGVSIARNTGIGYVEGKYVNLLDSDDKWALDAFEKVYDYFEQHYNEIDLLACRIKLFEAQNNFHGLDYRFWGRGTRIADLNDPSELFTVQFTNAPTFVKAETIKDNEALRFDPRLKFGQDSVFTNKIILEKCKYGLLKEALFYYRKRQSNNSAVNKMAFEKFYYTDKLDYYHRELFRYSKEKYNEVIPYIRSVVACDLMWRFDRSEVHNVLSEEEYNTFKQTCYELLSQVDDKIIFGLPVQKTYTRRSVAINFKYNIDYFKALKLEDSKLFFREFQVFDMSNNGILCTLNSLGFGENRCTVEILIANWLLRATESGGKLVLKVGDKVIKPKEILDYPQKTVDTIDGKEWYYSSYIFKVKLKAKDGEPLQLTPYLVYGEKESPIFLNCKKFAPNGKSPASDCLVQGRYFVNYDDGAIQISQQ